MAIQSASAALTVTSESYAITGFIYYQNGILDEATNSVKASSAGNTWGNLDSWNNWKTYNAQIAQIRWTAPLIDLGSVQYFTLDIQAVTDGTVSYHIHVSETGLFTGEESYYVIEDGDYDVASFYGQYAYVTAFVDSRELISLVIKTNTSTVEYVLNDVNTSTLAGTAAERTIVLPRSVSRITDIYISAQAATTYPVNLYVSDTATSKFLIPVIISKSNTAPKFALYGVDNDPRDGIVDIRITALPRMIMYGGRLTVVE